MRFIDELAAITADNSDFNMEIDKLIYSPGQKYITPGNEELLIEGAYYSTLKKVGTGKNFNQSCQLFNSDKELKGNITDFRVLRYGDTIAAMIIMPEADIPKVDYQLQPL